MKQKPDWINRLKDIGLHGSKLAVILGYTPAAVTRRMQGSVAWTLEDAMRIEHVTAGKVKASEIVPKFFASLSQLPVSN